MVPDRFIELLTRNLKTENIVVSKSQLGKLSSMSMSYTDDVLDKIIIPDITQRIITQSKDSKKIDIDKVKSEVLDKLKQNQILPLPLPVRTNVNKNKDLKLRRFNAWAKLLAPLDKYTRCVAITYFSNEFIISSNSPIDTKDETLLTMLQQKLTLILGYFDTVYNDCKEFPPDDHELILSIRADKVVDELKGYGGYAPVVPKDKSKRKCLSEFSHLKNALIKLGFYYIQGKNKNYKSGFSKEEIDAIDGRKFIFLLPKNVESSKLQYHAEQLLAYYTHYKIALGARDFDDKIFLGISKLCCETCHNVLAELARYIYTGSHGISFPNVADIFTLKELYFKPTRMDQEQNFSDGESDNECDRESKCLLSLKEAPSKDVVDKKLVNVQPLTLEDLETDYKKDLEVQGKKIMENPYMKFSLNPEIEHKEEIIVHSRTHK